MTRYIGRFAPSPTGPLHLGSLLTALASFLDARANKGLWHVRMEDIDPPREQSGAANDILNTLVAHGLSWDGDVLYQSSRLDSYKHSIHTLLERECIYACTCSRQQLKNHSIYSGVCRNKSIPIVAANAALRIKCPKDIVTFRDEIQGIQNHQMTKDVGDFVVFRKDGRTAYQLAVALDDHFQNITHVVRGSDLLDSTTRQIFIMQQFNLAIPSYSHIPIIVNQEGQKLSKQTYAAALLPEHANANLYYSLVALGQTPNPSLLNTPVSNILEWGISHWNIHKVPQTVSISENSIHK